MPPSVARASRASTLASRLVIRPLRLFLSFFPYSPFYRDIGSPFPSPVHALISDGWVQPSQPTPTPTLSSLLSGCLLTHAMSSLSSLPTVPIALSAVAMFLVCFWNELLGTGVEDKTHRHRLTQPAVHLPSRAGLLYEDGARMTTVDPRRS